MARHCVARGDRRNGVAPESTPTLAGGKTDGFDDVIVLDPSPEVLDASPPVVAVGATVNLVGERPLTRPVQVDAGRVHYDYITYLGTRGGYQRRLWP